MLCRDVELDVAQEADAAQANAVQGEQFINAAQGENPINAAQGENPINAAQGENPVNAIREGNAAPQRAGRERRRRGADEGDERPRQRRRGNPPQNGTLFIEPRFLPCLVCHM